MKKFLFLLSIIYWSCNCYAQINILQNNIQAQDPNEIFINGISTREDIGGVNIQAIPINYNVRCYEPSGRYSHTVNDNGYLCLTLENYNEFPVTVIIQYEEDYSTKVATITLPPARNGNYPAKEIKFGKKDQNGETRYPSRIDNIISITRKLGGR